jgi:hypothetical protein
MKPLIRRVQLLAGLFVFVLIAGVLAGAARAVPVSSPAPIYVEPAARYGHTMTMVSTEGDDYLFGGRKASGPTNELWSYNSHSMGSPWLPVMPTGSAPTPRYYHAATVVSGELWIFGGLDAAGHVLGDIWTYHPRTNAWEQRTSSGAAPEPRWGHTATAIGDKIYLYGGWNATSLADDYMYILDALTRTWTRGARVGAPCGPRYGHSAVPTSYGISIFGGFQEMGVPAASFTYQPASNNWQTLSFTGSGFPPIGLYATAWRGNTAWTLGGESLGGAETNIVSQITFSSATMATGMVLEPLPASRADAQAVVLNPTGSPYMLVFGGRRLGVPVAEELIYIVGDPLVSPTPTRTRTPTITRTATSSLTPTRTGTVTLTPTRTQTSVPTKTPTPTNTIVLTVHLSLPLVISTYP